MFRMIGKLFLGIGLLTTAGIVIWGWDNKIFDLSQTGTAVGLRRLFFLLLYLPIPMSVTIIGLALTFRDWIARSIIVKRIALVASALLFFHIISFVVFNIIDNIIHYEMNNLINVLMTNFVFASPILLLSMLLFLISRMDQGDSSNASRCH